MKSSRFILIRPAIYAIKKLVDYIHMESKLAFYFDLHAHGTKKGCFMYGNALTDFIDQVESNVFCKLIATNCINF